MVDSVLIGCETPAERVSAQLVGGKAWMLFALTREGLRVPPFRVVSSRLFEALWRDRRPSAEAALRDLDYGDPASVVAVSRQIGEWIGRLGSPLLWRGLRAELRGSWSGPSRLAVRSSAVGEDGADHTFAGVFESKLNVPLERVAEAIRRVWASAFSPRALLYRKQAGLEPGHVRLAVVLQQMVEPAASGVLFSRDPHDGGRRCVIAAGLGLGEGVVASRVEADTYRIGWDSQRIQREVPVKASRVLAAEGGGTRLEALPASLGERPVLDEAAVRELRDLGVELEGRFGTPQDVEWAYDAHGTLYVLQARPIVKPGRRPVSTEPSSDGRPTPPEESRIPTGPVRVWDNANIVESYPGLTLPLTFSFVRRAYALTFRRAMRTLFPMSDPFRHRAQVFDGLLGLLWGRVYYNLSNWYELFGFLPRPDHYKKSWNRMLGVSGDAVAGPGAITRVERGLALLVATSVLLRVKSIAHRFDRRFRRFYAEYRSSGCREASADAVLDRYRALERSATGFWHLTLLNDFCAVKYVGWLTELCRRSGVARPEEVANTLLAGHYDLESVVPVRSALALAERVRSSASWRQLFLEERAEAVWRRMAEDDSLIPLRHAFGAHLRDFGDRGPEELKLETRTLREDPSQLVRLVQGYCAAQEVPRPPGGEPVARRAAEQAVRRGLKGPIERLAFRFVLRQARSAIRCRESMRLARSRLYGIVRRLLGRLGKILRAAGCLESDQDVHYLTLDEVADLVTAAGVTQDLKSLVAIRQAEYSAHAEAEPPERLETRGLPLSTAIDLGGDAADVEAPGKRRLGGIGCSGGATAGTALIVRDPQRARVAEGQVLVAPSTDPGWVFLMMMSRGMVVERGSVLSHTAIIGRELGIPTVVGVKGATRLIPPGAALEIDGSTGEVQWQ